MATLPKTKRLKVLAYHKVLDLDKFEKQLNYLKGHYNLISLTTLKEYIYNKQDLPNNPLLVTFDDGDKSLYKNAFPILKKLNIPSVIFIITDLIDSQKPFWWDEIEHYLGKEKGNIKVWEIKNWKNIDRENYLRELRQDHKKSILRDEQLTTPELIEMQNAGFDIANHSHTHPMFNNCDSGELSKEMGCSMEILKNLEFSPDVFAYPNGNFSSNAEKILRDKGVKFAFLFDHKINKRNINTMRISRLRVDDNTPLWKLRFILSGLHSDLLPLIKATAKFINK